MPIGIAITPSNSIPQGEGDEVPPCVDDNMVADNTEANGKIVADDTTASVMAHMSYH